MKYIHLTLHIYIIKLLYRQIHNEQVKFLCRVTNVYEYLQVVDGYNQLRRVIRTIA